MRKILILFIVFSLTTSIVFPGIFKESSEKVITVYNSYTDKVLLCRTNDYRIVYGYKENFLTILWQVNGKEYSKQFYGNGYYSVEEIKYK